MSARDVFHDLVKTALQTDGWVISADPLHIRIAGLIDMYIDLGAEKLIAAEKADRRIAVEIKSFISGSNISDFHTAIGQYINYRYALEAEDPERSLYLAIPLNTYTDFFTLPFIANIVQRSQLNLLVYDVETKVIVKWIP